MQLAWPRVPAAVWADVAATNESSGKTRAMHKDSAEIRARIGEALNALREWWRGASGAYAYDCYLNHAEKSRSKRLTAQEFYLDEIERKYSRPNRCC
jgi:hypothetical protein